MRRTPLTKTRGAVLMLCTVIRAYRIPLFMIFGTFYLFRSNLERVLAVALMALFRQKRLETLSLGTLSSTSFRDGSTRFCVRHNYGYPYSHNMCLTSDPESVRH